MHVPHCLGTQPRIYASVCESVAVCHIISFVMLSSLALRAIEVFCAALGTAINGYASVSFVDVPFHPISALKKSHLICCHQMPVQVLLPRCSFRELPVEK